MNMQPLRIGILGAAGIVRNRNWQAIRCSGNCEVAAVATRDLHRTHGFIREMQAAFPFPTVPKAHAGYDELLADPSIEAVYLPLPTALRKPWVLRAARAGKHVICEKPCAVDAHDLREMLDACRQNKVQFMDGVMFMHSPRLGRIRTLMDDRENFGITHRITSAFSFLASDDFHRENIRANRALEPLGCLGDLGWYCIRFSLWAMHWQMPLRVRGSVLSGGDGPPKDFSGEMVFAGGVSAAFYCSFGASFQQWAHVSGSRGYVPQQEPSPP
jgi:predicted dehydrogenase